MRRHFIFLSLVVFLVVSFGQNSDAQRKRSKSKKPRPKPAPEVSYACVDPVTLSHREVFIPCKTGYVPTESCPDTSIINVAVKASDPDPDKEDPPINYEVSGGKIIGEGELVQWDLSAVRKAGVYLLTIDFLDHNNERQKKFETVTVRNCDCPNDCICPERFVSASKDVVAPAETVIFTANLKGVSVSEIDFKWTVSGGEIIEGQGTLQIKVQTTPETNGSELTATVETGSNDICSFCEPARSKTVTIKR